MFNSRWFPPLLLLVALVLAGSAQGKSEQQEPASSTVSEGKKVYRHVVMFKFKEEAAAEQIDEVISAFGRLQHEIKSIIGYEHGTDVSPEKLAKGFTHCFLVTFRSKEDLEAYLPHPAHEAFTRKLKPILADVLVIDYWAQH